MSFFSEIKELAEIIRQNKNWAINGIINAITTIYYSICFHLTKIIELCHKPINLVVDIVTIVASIWCICNIVWQIGFETEAETNTQLLIANRNIIGLFSFVQIYKLLTYIHTNSFSPLQTLGRMVNTQPFRKVAKRSLKQALGILWRKFIKLFSPSEIWKHIKQLFCFLFIGNRVPLGEVAYSVLTCLYYWYMPEFGVTYGDWHDIVWHRYTITIIVAIIAMNEMLRLGITILGRHTSPTALFIGSFLIIIAIGCGLLLMPKSNYGNLTFFDALFTSTSAVCVNGLLTIDIPTTLTPFGQGILLILIQVGGIGVMTFTCFFALSLTGRASLQNRFIIKDLVSADNMTSIFQTLKRIMVVTLIIEGSAAWAIYHYMEMYNTNMSTYTLIFYSIFHSISAFCNAGFSNIDSGMMNPAIVNLKSLQIIIALTVILGGLGFPLQSAAIDWCKHHIKMFVYKMLNRNYSDIFRSRLINATNRIVFFTHIGLVIIGTIIFLATESTYTQSACSWDTRLCNSFFMSVCARTAGFNIVDLTQLGPLTLLILTGLMWIGCAPLSTGGGIKVTTFAIFILNIRSVLRRRDTIEVYGRQISGQSIRRAFAIIGLSGFFMLTCAILFKTFDPQIGMARLMFEASSAVYTGGMTLDVTTHLSLPSQIVLLLAMFIGRIGILSFALCFIEPAPKQYYSYPHENVTV